MNGETRRPATIDRQGVLHEPIDQPLSRKPELVGVAPVDQVGRPGMSERPSMPWSAQKLEVQPHPWSKGNVGDRLVAHPLPEPKIVAKVATPGAEAADQPGRPHVVADPSGRPISGEHEGAATPLEHVGGQGRDGRPAETPVGAVQRNAGVNVAKAGAAEPGPADDTGRPMKPVVSESLTSFDDKAAQPPADQQQAPAARLVRPAKHEGAPVEPHEQSAAHLEDRPVDEKQRSQAPRRRPASGGVQRPGGPRRPGESGPEGRGPIDRPDRGGAAPALAMANAGPPPGHPPEGNAGGGRDRPGGGNVFRRNARTAHPGWAAVGQAASTRSRLHCSVMAGKDGRSRSRSLSKGNPAY